MPEFIAKLNGHKQTIAVSVPLLGVLALVIKLVFSVGALTAKIDSHSQRLDRIEVRVDQIVDGLHGRR